MNELRSLSALLDIDIWLLSYCKHKPKQLKCQTLFWGGWGVARLRATNPASSDYDLRIVSGHLPDQISPEVAGCADVILSKPVPVETFESLFESAARIGEEMEQVRLLGNMPVTA